ncbi:MAG: HNH endonuclease [Phycisphaeraceae bacterium]
MAKDDLVFCHQTDLHGLVGMTLGTRMAPSRSKDGERKHCEIRLGPRRIRFQNVVQIADITRSIGVIAAYAPGRKVATFHEVEAIWLHDLIELCMRINPDQVNEIRSLVGETGNVRKRVFEQQVNSLLADPIRKEMVIEAFDRNARWAREAKETFGTKCMIPGCKFQLTKINGDKYIEVHHIKPMCEGGSPNDLRNLSVLCPNHHRTIHYANPKVCRKLEWQVRSRQRVLLARLAARQLAALGGSEKDLEPIPRRRSRMVRKTDRT